MSKPSQKKFPHFSRRISAWLFFCVLSFGYFFLALLLFVNIFSDFFLEPSSERRLQNALLARPFSFSSHANYASFLLSINEAAAQRELHLAHSFLSSSPVLSSDDDTLPADRRNTSLASTGDDANDDTRIIWEYIADLFPDYSYAKLALARIHYMNGNTPVGSAFVSRLLIDSPYFSLTPEMKRFFDD